MFYLYGDALKKVLRYYITENTTAAPNNAREKRRAESIVSLRGNVIDTAK